MRVLEFLAHFGLVMSRVEEAERSRCWCFEFLAHFGQVMETIERTDQTRWSYRDTRQGWRWVPREASGPAVRLMPGVAYVEDSAPRAVVDDRAQTVAYEYGDLPEVHATLKSELG